VDYLAFWGGKWEEGMGHGGRWGKRRREEVERWNGDEGGVDGEVGGKGG